MRRFGTFVRRSIAQGLRWLHGILGWWLVLVGTLGLVGVVIVFETDNWPTWLWVQVISVAVVALFIVGAYQVWDRRTAVFRRGFRRPPRPTR